MTSYQPERASRHRDVPRRRRWRGLEAARPGLGVPAKTTLFARGTLGRAWMPGSSVSGLEAAALGEVFHFLEDERRLVARP
jgi:hypothetical protein